MNETPLWLVIGDKAGDNTQLLVIAEALGLPYEVRRMIPRKEYIYGKPLENKELQASAILRPKYYNF